MSMKRCLPSILAVVLFGIPAFGADTINPIDVRYKSADADEVPDFQKHVMPLMGKLGCNGRACHGSFQGRGGFRLSLFGYDFKMDHENLTSPDDARIDLENPEISMILEKPTLESPHEGGKRFDKESWQYRVFFNWIKGGAKNVADDHATFVRLDISPAEIVFQNKGEKVQLKAVAVWSDGTQEDVTPLCRFQSNSSQVAAISKSGEVTANEPGDTHVVAFYDVGVVPVPVIRPVTDKVGPNYPKIATPTKIDELVVQKLRKLGVVPSDLADDVQFLRRVSLDITGTLPTPQEVEQFLADSSADKRSQKIDQLLESPAYAAWWTTRLCDITGNNDDQLNNIVPVRGQASKDWYNWIHKRVTENVPYDEIVAGIVTATSRNKGENFQDYSKTMSDLYRDMVPANRRQKGKKGQQKPAPLELSLSKTSFADRESMPHYWARRNFRSAEERVIGFAYTFMGIRIQCAQCHKHPFDQWTQDDFKNFTGFFTATAYGTSPESNQEYTALMKELGLAKKKGGNLRRELPKLLKAGKTIPFQEVYALKPPKNENVGNKNKKRRKPQKRRGRGGRRAKSAKLLGDENIDLTQHDDVRTPLMAWLRDSNNGYFARAFVNRVWAGYFNVGIVDPPDDLSLANPPSNKPLLDYLSRGFIDNGFDMKWLHREIANSRTYQLSWTPNETNRLDEVNFSHAIPRRLPAEVAYDALVYATSSDEAVAKLRENIAGRAISIPGAGRRGVGGNLGYALTIFGRSIRETNCDCDRSSEASLLQTVYLQNDRDVLNMIDRGRDGWLSQVARELGTTNPAAVNVSNRNTRTPQKPKNFKQIVAKQRAQIEKLKKAGNTRQVKRLEQRLAGYLKKFGLDKAVQQPAKQTKNTKPKSKKIATVDSAAIVRKAYLRTLSRPPSDDELARSQQYIEQADDTVSGIRGLLWALLNTKEFIVNH